MPIKPEDLADPSRGNLPPPISAGRKSASGTTTGRKGIDKHILYWCANTNRFYSVSEIMTLVDPLNSLMLPRSSFTTAIGIMKRSHSVRITERPGAKGDNRYRF